MATAAVKTNAQEEPLPPAGKPNPPAPPQPKVPNAKPPAEQPEKVTEQPASNPGPITTPGQARQVSRYSPEIKAMGRIDRLMDGLPSEYRPFIAAWFNAKYGNRS